MDFLRKIAEIVVPIIGTIQRIIQPIVRSIQNAVGGNTVGALPGPSRGPTAEDIRREQQRQEEEKQRQRTTRKLEALDKDIAQARPQAASQPAVTRDVQSGNQDLSIPAAAGLHLQVEAAAQQVNQVLRVIPGIVATVLSTAPSVEVAFEFLLAGGIDLTAKEINYLIEKYGAGIPKCAATAQSGGPGGGGPYPQQNENEGVLTLPDGTKVPVKGQWVSSPGGRIFVVGSYITDDSSRQGGGNSGYLSFLPPEHPLLGAVYSPYLSYVTANSEIFQDAATKRYDELKKIINSLPPGVLTKLPRAALEDLKNLTPEEFAARMVTVPMTMNVPGWMGDIMGTRNTEEPVWKKRLQLSLINPDNAGVIYGFLGLNKPFGDVQSAGFLELRYSQFYNLLTGSTVPIGNDKISISGDHSSGELRLFGGQYYSAYVNAGTDFLYPTTDPTTNLLSDDLDRPSTFDARILAQLEAARLEAEYVQYIEFWQDPGNYAKIDPQRPETFWYMTSPTAFAINQASAGFTGDLQAPKAAETTFNDWWGSYYPGMVYFRGVFNSSEKDTLIAPSDYDLAPSPRLNPPPYKGAP
jgi:hypothetical protein